MRTEEIYLKLSKQDGFLWKMHQENDSQIIVILYKDRSIKLTQKELIDKIFNQ